MKIQTNTFIFSFLTHTALVGCAFALSQQAMPDKPPIVVNFTLEQTASPTQATSSPQSGEENNGAREDIAVEKTPTEPPKEIVEKPVEKDKPDVLPKKKAAVQKIKRKPVEKTVPTDSPLPAPVTSSEPLSSSAHSVNAGDEGVISPLPKTAAGHGGQSTGKDTASPGGQYLQKNYEYIRKHIMDNLSYPALAQKMGWRGKVLVSFIINVGGDVEAVTIISSCGHELLDTNVIKTIHKAAPFPKPPERAQIILPIVYDLKST
jgi:periplasmic protein TonB